MTRIEKLRKIVREHQHAKIEGYLVDGFTASGLVQVYDALSEENRAKFAALPLPQMVDVMWRLVERCKA
jgi:hypothetical protein